jgi:hypothetical protein
MSEAKERKFLATVLQQLDRKPRTLAQRVLTDALLWLVLAIAYFLLFRFWNSIHPLLVLLIATIIGIPIGIVTFLQSFGRYWQYLRPHVTRETMIERLRALDERRAP